ncbi:response regulator [Thioclava sp. BHET1]|nr:response regulator [Thioclava sp. BHET1]
MDDGSAAADFLHSSAADVIVLDVNLPGRDGISLLRDLRHGQTTIPVLMLTARSATPQRIEGLDAGADMETNAVDLLISRRRRKLDGTGVAIRTARGLGYMLPVAPT